MSNDKEKPPEQEYSLEQLRAMVTTPMLAAHLSDYYGAVKQLYAVLTERRAVPALAERDAAIQEAGKVGQLMNAAAASARQDVWSEAIKVAEAQYELVGPQACAGYEERAAHSRGVHKVIEALEAARERCAGT